MVFVSGIQNMEMVGWEIALEDAIISKSEIDEIYKLNNEVAKFAIDCNIHAYR